SKNIHQPSGSIFDVITGSVVLMNQQCGFKAADVASLRRGSGRCPQSRRDSLNQFDAAGAAAPCYLGASGA
ncbi:hypothetical protein ACWKW4_19935, partial [Hydrogenophaga borbori]